MKNFTALLSLCFLFAISFDSCKKDPEPILGCMDVNSLTYNSTATQDDGSCEYPDKFMPMAIGNEWHLSDDVPNPLGGTILVTADFTMTGDTTIDGTHYYKMHEVIAAGALGSEVSDYLYRQATTGEVFRTAIGDSVETLFLEYPLDLGTDWYDTADQTGYYFSVFSTALISVPSGDFAATGIHSTNMADGTTFDNYFAKDVGLIRVDITYELAPLPAITAQIELDSYTLH